MASLQKYFDDPQFHQLSKKAQIIILGKEDEKFKDLSPQAQSIVLQKGLKSGRESVAAEVERFKHPGDPRFDPEVAGQRTIGKGVRGIDPRMVGATYGAARGSRLGVGGMIVGGMLGGLAGEAADVTYELATDQETAPKTYEEAINRLGWATAKSGIEELAGNTVLGATNKVVAPFGKTVTAEAKIAWNMLEKYMPKRKAPVMPAEATTHWGLDFLHNISEKSFFGGRSVLNYKELIRSKAVDNMVGDLASMFGKEADPVALGQMITDVLDHRWRKYKEALTDPLYNAIAERTKVSIKKVPIRENQPTGLLNPDGSPMMREVVTGYDEIEIADIWMSTSKLKDAVSEDLRRIRKLRSIGDEASGDKLVLGVSKLPEKLDIASAIDLRKRLIAQIDEISVTNKKAPAIGKAKHLLKITDDLISGTLKTKNKEVYHLWRHANKLYKEGSATFNNRFLRSLIKQADPEKGFGRPEQVLNMIFVKKGVSGLRKLKKAIGDENFHQLKGWYLNDLILKSTTKDGVVDGKAFMRNMFGATGMGKQAMGEIFDKTELAMLKNNAITLGVIQAKQAGGAGGMMIQLAQPTAATGALTGYVSPWVPIAVFAGPEVLARMFLSKKLARWAMNTKRLPQKSALAVSNIARFTNIVNEIENKVFKEKQKDLKD